MSSARKRGAIQKANNEADQLRQSLILANYHGAMMKGVAEVLAKDAQRYRTLRNASMDERNRLEHYAGEALDAAIDAAAESYNAGDKL